MRRLYAVYAVSVAAACLWMLWSGWWYLSVDKLDGVPKSVRDNPGSYRSHYAHYSRYFGGK